MPAEPTEKRQQLTVEQRRRAIAAARGFYAGPSRSRRAYERRPADGPIVGPHQDPFGAVAAIEKRLNQGCCRESRDTEKAVTQGSTLSRP